jgi:CBS domain containing-hemolysin-like protein
LVVVGNENQVVGIISLSDILRHLILETPTEQNDSQQKEMMEIQET